jgi:hypothetical protein
MNKRLLLVASLAVATLVGCSLIPFAPPPATLPQVSIVDGHLVVSPEPLNFRVGEGEIVVVWRLPAGSGYSFPPNGIVPEGQWIEKPVDIAKSRAAAPRVLKQYDLVEQDQMVCPPQQGGTEFRCINKRTKKGHFKYTINVVGPDKQTLTLDPGYWNF